MNGASEGLVRPVNYWRIVGVVCIVCAMASIQIEEYRFVGINNRQKQNKTHGREERKKQQKE